MATRKLSLAERVIERAKVHQSFLGYVLTLYQQSRGQSEADLANWLGCTPEQLGRLSLCRRPAGTDATFKNDVEALAQFAGVDAGRLVQVLRAAESIVALRDTSATGGIGLPPLRLAAREVGKADCRDKPESGEEEGP